MANGMFKMKKDIDRHGPRLMSNNNCQHRDPAFFSLPTSNYFKQIHMCLQRKPEAKFSYEYLFRLFLLLCCIIILLWSLPRIKPKTIFFIRQFLRPLFELINSLKGLSVFPPLCGLRSFVNILVHTKTNNEVPQVPAACRLFKSFLCVTIRTLWF